MSTGGTTNKKPQQCVNQNVEVLFLYKIYFGQLYSVLKINRPCSTIVFGNH